MLVPFLAALSPGVWNQCDARASAAEAARADFFVSPQGDDRWSGALPEPNPQRTDGPLATAECARDAVRQLRAAQQLDRPVRILFRGGTYRRTQPLVLRPEDAGTDGSPTIYESYPGEKAVLSGGTVISGWQRDKGPLWKVELPEVKSGRWYFRQLFVNGQRRLRPRLPKEGVFVAGGPAEDGHQRLDGRRPGGQESVGPAGVSVQAGRHPQGLDQPGRRGGGRAPVLDGSPPADPARSTRRTMPCSSPAEVGGR